VYSLLNLIDSRTVEAKTDNLAGTGARNKAANMNLRE